LPNQISDFEVGAICSQETAQNRKLSPRGVAAGNQAGTAHMLNHESLPQAVVVLWKRAVRATSTSRNLTLLRGLPLHGFRLLAWCNRRSFALSSARHVPASYGICTCLAVRGSKSSVAHERVPVALLWMSRASWSRLRATS